MSASLPDEAVLPPHERAPRDEVVLARLVAWLNRRLAPPGRSIGPDTPLFAGGLINSIRVLDLIAWVERELGREIADVEIRMDNFATPARVAEHFFRDTDADAGTGDARPMPARRGADDVGR